MEPKDIPAHFICPISLDIMNDPVMLSDGKHYDLKSIVPWLLRRSISPLTNETVSYRLTPDKDLAREIRRSGFIPMPSRLDTSIEGEPFTSWFKREEMGEVEWRNYLTLRKLYWLIKFQESSIPEWERVYIEYNNSSDNNNNNNGKGTIHTEQPSSFYQFTSKCPNRFTTLWVVLQRDDIRGITRYLWDEPKKVREYALQYGCDDRRTLVHLWWTEQRLVLFELVKRLLDGPIVLLPMLFMVICLVYALFMFVHSNQWIVSLKGYPFIICLCLVLVIEFARRKWVE